MIDFSFIQDIADLCRERIWWIIGIIGLGFLYAVFLIIKAMMK